MQSTEMMSHLMPTVGAMVAKEVTLQLVPEWNPLGLPQMDRLHTWSLCIGERMPLQLVTA